MGMLDGKVAFITGAARGQGRMTSMSDTKVSFQSGGRKMAGAVRVPDGVDGKAVQRQLLAEGIEVGGGLGPDAPPIWRIGLMGANAHTETADHVFESLAAAVDSQADPRRDAAGWRARC